MVFRSTNSQLGEKNTRASSGLSKRKWREMKSTNLLFAYRVCVCVPFAEEMRDGGDGRRTFFRTISYSREMRDERTRRREANIIGDWWTSECVCVRST